MCRETGKHGFEAAGGGATLLPTVTCRPGEITAFSMLFARFVGGSLGEWVARYRLAAQLFVGRFAAIHKKFLINEIDG